MHFVGSLQMCSRSEFKLFVVEFESTPSRLDCPDYLTQQFQLFQRCVCIPVNMQVSYNCMGMLLHGSPQAPTLLTLLVRRFGAGCTFSAALLLCFQQAAVLWFFA